jgi:hypothetical protein
MVGTGARAVLSDVKPVGAAYESPKSMQVAKDKLIRAYAPHQNGGKASGMFTLGYNWKRTNGLPADGMMIVK